MIHLVQNNIPQYVWLLGDLTLCLQSPTHCHIVVSLNHLSCICTYRYYNTYWISHNVHVYRCIFHCSISRIICNSIPSVVYLSCVSISMHDRASIYQIRYYYREGHFWFHSEGHFWFHSEGLGCHLMREMVRFTLPWGGGGCLSIKCVHVTWHKRWTRSV